MSKRKPETVTLTRHPASAAYPDDETRLASLAKSIKAEGLLDRIVVTPNDEVIDGWNRKRALDMLGIPITREHLRVYEGDPYQLAHQLQSSRRNMTNVQQAIIRIRLGESDAEIQTRCGLSFADSERLRALHDAQSGHLDSVLTGELKSLARAHVLHFGRPPKPVRHAPMLPDRSHVMPRPNRAKIMRTPAPIIDPDEAPDHLVIPDTQVKPGVPLVHLKWIAQYAARKRPAKIVHLGDHYDLPSLSSYDKGTRRAEGRRLSNDIAAGVLALRIFDEELRRHAPGYAPEKHMLTGNHEIRLQRHIDASPELEGALAMTDLRREEFGWEVHEFLEMKSIDGVLYSHYFTHNAHGRVVQSKRGQPSARDQVKRVGVPCVAGHSQSLDVHYQSVPGLGRLHTGIIAGSCYLHEEEYLTDQGTDYWRGILMLNSVVDGNFALWSIDLDWLCRRFEGKPLNEFLASATDSQLMIADV